MATFRDMQMNPLPYSWILFDWNGTLVNDLDLCLEIHQDIRRRAGLSDLSKKDYLDQFGFPLADFYTKVGFDLVNPSFETITSWFMNEYYQRQEEHQLFSDARTVLQKLKAQGFKLAILSASRHQRLLDAVNHFELGDLFDAVLGIKDDFAASKAAELKQLMDEYKLSPAQVLFVGDTHHDAEIALDQGLDYRIILRGHQSAKAMADLPKLQTFNTLEELYESLQAKN